MANASLERTFRYIKRIFKLFNGIPSRNKYMIFLYLFRFVHWWLASDLVDNLFLKFNRSSNVLCFTVTLVFRVMVVDIPNLSSSCGRLVGEHVYFSVECFIDSLDDYCSKTEQRWICCLGEFNCSAIYIVYLQNRVVSAVRWKKPTGSLWSIVGWK